MSERSDASLHFDELTAVDPAARSGVEVGVSGSRCRAKVIVVGFFPPPIDGQRLITQRMSEEIAAHSPTRRLNLDAFPRFRRLSKPLSVGAVALGLARRRLAGFDTVYFAPHSGMGLVYSCLIAWLSRILGFRLFVHYHSFRNVARHSRLMESFARSCGRGATHIVLAPPMEWGLRYFYPRVDRVAVVSNTVFVTPRRVARQPSPAVRIGHLSNLSREKGIEMVLASARRLIQMGIDVELVLGGPATDRTSREMVAKAAVDLGRRLRYLGQLSRSEVDRFYEEIDVFLFPTLHEHEAEPLVVIDAVSAGVPVLATNRGCIGYLLAANGGLAFEPFDFVERSVAQIALWAKDRALLSKASAQAEAAFGHFHRDSQEQLGRILADILEPI